MEQGSTSLQEGNTDVGSLQFSKSKRKSRISAAVYCIRLMEGLSWSYGILMSGAVSFVGNEKYLAGLTKARKDCHSRKIRCPIAVEGEAMRIFFGPKAMLGFAVLCLLSLGAYGADQPGDGATDTDSSAKPAPKTEPASKPASGLTEREQWMLERIEKLEKRVAELESKGATEIGASSPTTAPAAPAGSPAPATASAFSAKAPEVESSSASNVNPKQDQTSSTTAAAPATTEKPKYVEPFSDADWTWLNGNPRTKEIFWDTKFFTPEIRADTNYVADFNHPADHSIGGSSELFRSYEVQLEQLGVGGDFHYDNVRARLMTQFGMYSVTTPRNDPSPGHGQWDLANAYRYVSEA